MREFVDTILGTIGAESLTDLEFESMDIAPPPRWDVGVYQKIKAVLDGRSTVSKFQKRLEGLFIAKGVPVSGTAHTPATNILIGRPL